MTAVLIIGGLLLAIRLISKVSDGVGDKVQSMVDGRYRAWLQRRVALRRVRERRAGRPAGSQPRADDRWKAGAIDLGSAILVGIFVAVTSGIERYTETTYSGYGDVSTRDYTEVNPSFWVFVAAAVALYAANGWRASKSASGQTVGQEIFDYSVRQATGAPLTGTEYLKRHMLRPVAAVFSVPSDLGDTEQVFKHDAWMKTKVASLGQVAAPAAPTPPAPTPTPTPHREQAPAPEHAPDPEPQAEAERSPAATAATSAEPAAEQTPPAPTPQSETSATCGACGQQFTNEAAARRHALKAHFGDGAEGTGQPVKIIK